MLKIQRLLKRGAEADVFLASMCGKTVVVKTRRKKHYIHPVLEQNLRVQRTLNEVKVLVRAKLAGINVPTVYFFKNSSIVMEYITGKKLELSEDNVRKALKLLTQLHEQHIVHNDFSFNNLLQTQAGVYVIDFGLATLSKRIEDKGVDLWVFKRSLPPQLKDMVNEYAQWGDPKVIKQLTVIEKRGRYKKG